MYGLKSIAEIWDVVPNIYIINIQGMYLYVYIIVGVCCILNGQLRSKIQVNEIIYVYIMLYITSVN